MNRNLPVQVAVERKYLSMPSLGALSLLPGVSAPFGPWASHGVGSPHLHPAHVFMLCVFYFFVSPLTISFTLQHAVFDSS